jgi:hypothetical protein
LWLLHHTQPSWSGIQVLNKNTVVQPSCAGILCDRQEILNANGACGCFHKTQRSEAAVLEEKPMSLELAPNSQLESFRSLSWTKLFINNRGVLAKMPSKDLDIYAFTNLQKAMKELHHYVNQRGGYTILGYMQLGESTDVSDKLMKVGSLHPTTHLV